MTLSQQQPIMAGVLDQSATRLHQPRLQAWSLSPVRFLAWIKPSGTNVRGFGATGNGKSDGRPEADSGRF